MKKKSIKSGKCIIDIEGDLSNQYKPKIRISVSGKCNKLDMDKLSKQLS